MVGIDCDVGGIWIRDIVVNVWYVYDLWCMNLPWFFLRQLLFECIVTLFLCCCVCDPPEYRHLGTWVGA